MPSKKQILVSALLCAAIGMSAGCQGEPEPLLDPKTGEPLTEKEVGYFKMFSGISEPTQKKLNEYHVAERRELGDSDTEVHPKALAAQDD